MIVSVIVGGRRFCEHVYNSTWTLRATDQKRLESFEMWCWRRMEISWTDRVRNEEVLLRVNEQRNILHTHTHTHTYIYTKILNYITNGPTCFVVSALSSGTFDIAFASYAILKLHKTVDLSDQHTRRTYTGHLNCTYSHYHTLSTAHILSYCDLLFYAILTILTLYLLTW